MVRGSHPWLAGTVATCPESGSALGRDGVGGASMRVAFLSDWWLPTTGGTERYMIDLGTHLQAEGHEVVVLHAVAPGSGLPQRETLEGLCTIRMPVSLP